MIDRRALIERITVNGALNARAHALVLAGQDQSWGTEVFGLAGGHAVLCGPGLYVNRAMAVGLTGPMSAADFELLEQRSAVVGVPPAVDVTPTTDRSVIDLAAVRGYRLLRFLTTHVLPLDGSIEAALPSDPSIIVERADGELLGVWQDVSAVGFDVAEGDARRVNDAFATAAAVVDRDGLLLASDAVRRTSARLRQRHDPRRVGDARRHGDAADASATRRAAGVDRPPAADRFRAWLRPRRVLDPAGQRLRAQPRPNRLPTALRDGHAGHGTSGERK